MALTVLFGLGLFLLIRSSAGPVDASASAEGEARVAGFRWRGGPVFSIGWSPDGQSVAATYWGSDLGIYQLGTGRVREVRLDALGTRGVVGWSPEGRGPMLWGLDGSIVIKATGGAGAASADERRGENDLATLARAGRGRSVRLTGPTDRRELALPESARPANCLAISPDGSSIASGGVDGFVRFFDLSSGRQRSTAKLHPRPLDYGGVSMVAFSPDGKELVACGAGPVRIFDPATGLERRRIGSTEGGYSIASHSPDGRRLAAATWNGTLQVWDSASGVEQRHYSRSPTRVVVLAWSPDGRMLASGGFDGEVSIWEANPVSGQSPAGPIAVR